jgi:pantoate--beta-alanine ligase
MLEPKRAYFGEKDFQQLAVVRRLVADLGLGVEIVGCPTVRELDGLACSSRNRRLSAEGRRAARVLYQALQAGASVVLAGERDPARVEEAMARVVAGVSGVQLCYAAAVDAGSLVEPNELRPPARLLIAAEVEGVRLIDNLAIEG